MYLPLNPLPGLSSSGMVGKKLCRKEIHKRSNGCPCNTNTVAHEPLRDCQPSADISCAVFGLPSRRGWHSTTIVTLGRTRTRAIQRQILRINPPPIHCITGTTDITNNPCTPFPCVNVHSTQTVWVCDRTCPLCFVGIPWLFLLGFEQARTWTH